MPLDFSKVPENLTNFTREVDLRICTRPSAYRKLKSLPKPRNTISQTFAEISSDIFSKFSLIFTKFTKPDQKVRFLMLYTYQEQKMVGKRFQWQNVAL